MTNVRVVVHLTEIRRGIGASGGDRAARTGTRARRLVSGSAT